MFGPITMICKDGHIEKHIKWAAFSFNEEDWQCIEDAQEILFIYDKPAILLSLLIHPYYGIDYIWVEWGGKEERLAEVAKGNFNAINWVEKAEEVMEQAMALYWTSQPQATAAAISKTTDTDNENDDSLSKFDCLRHTLVSMNNQGWEAELCSYFKDVHADVDKDADIVEWCKQTATDWCLCLGPEVFEELPILKAVWKPTIVNLAYENVQEIEVIDEDDDMKVFSTFLDKESALEAWEQDLDTVHD
ncbi:hypothetical protein H0H87_002999 [Tephrocybe sp. NHM501043]|nr:hypothetical protein H0H87_002999 [Tephrocybe sp. NHM501043]